MRRIVVTPAGRRMYMELLAGHLAAQRDSFDEWHIWLNTANEADTAFLKQQDAVIVEAPDSRPHDGTNNIHRFFPIDSCETDTLYLRLDDDVVWMEPGFVDTMFAVRELDREPLLIFANIVNNAICSHLHWRLGCVDYCGHACMDEIGWRDCRYAERVHREFLATDNLEAWKFPRWELRHHERCSINAVAWRGSVFAKFGGAVGSDEELWLTEQAPREHGHNVIHGRALCAHFAFHMQRAYLDTTDILDMYRKKSEEQWKAEKSPSSCRRAATSRSIGSWLRGAISSRSMARRS